MKQLSRSDLERILEQRGAAAPFVTHPYTHQLALYLLATRYPGYMIFGDMGVGKTKVALDAIAWRRSQGEIKRALVLVPNLSNIGGWVAEARIHQPKLAVAGLSAKRREERERLVSTEHDVLVCTYAGWQALLAKRQKGKRDIDPDRAAFLEGRYQMVVYDESTAIKNHQSLSFKLAKRLLKTAPFRLAMTGTPFDKDPADLWSQFRVVDNGETLGETLGLFRSVFFETRYGYFGGQEYKMRKDREEDLHRVLRHRSVRYSEEECLDLPERIDTRIPVELTAQQRRAYTATTQQLQQVLGNYTAVKNAYIRMRQITAGFLKVTDESTGDEDLLLYENPPKVAALLDILSEIPEEEKVIVFNVYHVTGDIICDALTKAKIKHDRLYGKTKDPAGVVEAFKRNKSTRVLVGSKSASIGLNLQVANHVVFYETFDSAIDRAQAEKRIRRAGQTKRTHYHDLVATGTVDEKILQAVKEGRELLAGIVDGTFDVGEL